jgi:hypothetical protein
LDRRFEIGCDLPFALSIFAWWPFMPPIDENNLKILQAERWDLFAGVATDIRVRDRLLRAVPPGLLDQSLEQLFDQLWRMPINQLIDFDVA